MNPFTHAHSFVSPGFYNCSIVMWQKLMKSADQSVKPKHILLMRSNLCCFS